MIYIRNETADILEIFDNVLVENGIKVPSPEDDDRGEDNEAALYGSVYYDLFDELEYILMHIVEQVRAGEEVITDRWKQNMYDIFKMTEEERFTFGSWLYTISEGWRDPNWWEKHEDLAEATGHVLKIIFE